MNKFFKRDMREMLSFFFKREGGVCVLMVFEMFKF
jgi:hypothetical protein